MNADQLRESYQQFFEERGHTRIASAPLQPENDPTVLFTTAGMHPLVPFLLGEPHPSGKRLVNFQKCIRTNDIDEVGDTSHLTFFEMLGNWSLGDYFKQESLPWSYEFLTRVLGLDPRRLAVTVFAGDSDAPRDDESAQIWRSLGLPTERIYFLPKSDNWWGPAGKTGPCGPDSEMFYDTGKPDHPGCRPGCACGKWFEVWNNVFHGIQ
jgi:alanyl-tRNA synthetase